MTTQIALFDAPAQSTSWEQAPSPFVAPGASGEFQEASAPLTLDEVRQLLRQGWRITGAGAPPRTIRMQHADGRELLQDADAWRVQLCREQEA